MRSALVLTTAGAALAAGLWFTLPWPTSSGLQRASVVVDETQRDLGRIDRRLHRVPFVIQNRGPRRLVLSERSAQCRCNRAAQRPVIIAPHSEAALEVCFDTRSVTGLVEKTAQYETSDPLRPRIELTIRARVE